MEPSHRHFIPAAGRDWLLPLYDPMLRVLRADTVKRSLREAAALAPGQRVLDLGCGTGSLLVLLSREHPGVDAVGLDPDRRALAVARRKLAREGSGDPPRPGPSPTGCPTPMRPSIASSARSCFHHLTREVKLESLREARRVLRAGGSFHLLDFGGSTAARRGLSRGPSTAMGTACTTTSKAGLPELLREAGFRDVEMRASRLLLMPLAAVRGTKPRPT